MDAPIGFLGLGKMGSGMARNLLKAGYPLVVYDVRESAVTELESARTQRGVSVADVAQRCSHVITMLPSPKEVEEVVLGKDGLKENMESGSTFIDMSTVGPHVSRRLAEAMQSSGVAMLDAPVSRGQEGALNGTLSIMVGGSRSVFDRTLPIFNAMGTDIFYCGPSGAGSAVKLVNNLIQGTITVIVAEGLVLGTKAGVDVSTLLKVLGASSADNFVLRNFYPKKALLGDFEPGGTVFTVQKDIELGLELGRKLQVPLLLGSLSHQLYGILSGRGDGDLDFTAILKLVEEGAGVKVRLSP